MIAHLSIGIEVEVTFTAYFFLGGFGGENDRGTLNLKLTLQNRIECAQKTSQSQFFSNLTEKPCSSCL